MAELKQNHTQKECFDSCQMEQGLEGWAKKMKRLVNSNWSLQNSQGGVKYSIENIVNNSLITMHGVIWV